MRKRGPTFWKWSDCELHSRCHAEELASGKEFDVEVRLSREGVIQMFIGVYCKAGGVEVEEYYAALSGRSLTDAIEQGTLRARRLAAGADADEADPLAGLLT